MRIELEQGKTYRDKANNLILMTNDFGRVLAGDRLDSTEESKLYHKYSGNYWINEKGGTWSENDDPESIELELEVSKDPDPRIVCAANKFDDGTIILGIRHFDHFMEQHFDNIPEFALDAALKQIKCEQGFVDQYGKFYDRYEAWLIAVQNDQIIRRVGCDGPYGSGLFSENLY